MRSKEIKKKLSTDFSGGAGGGSPLRRNAMPVSMSAEEALKIGIQMTCNLESEEIRRFPYIYSTGGAKEWFDELIREVASKMVRISDSLKEKRQASIRKIRFLSYREGQKDLAAGGLSDH